MPNPDGSSTSSSETRRAWLALALPCVAVLVVFLGALYVYREELAQIGRGNGVAEVGAFRRVRLAAKRPALAPRIVLFADSLAMCHGADRSADSLGRQMTARFRGGGVRVELIDLTQPALLPLHVYSLLDDALALRPAVLVVEINARTFLHAAARPGLERMPTITRMLSLPDALRVRQSLDLEGLTPFDPTIMRLEEQLGMLYVFQGVRDGVLDWIDSLALQLQKAIGLKHNPLAPLIQTDRRIARTTYMVDYAAHPTTTVLRAILEEARRADVPVVFWVAPIDVTGFEESGLADPAELSARLAALRTAVGATAEEWVDLHDLLPSETFRDRQNHLRIAGCQEVARQLARQVRRILATRRTR